MVSVCVRAHVWEERVGREHQSSLIWEAWHLSTSACYISMTCSASERAAEQWNRGEATRSGLNRTGGAKKGEGWIRTERCKERVSVPHDDVWWLCSRWIHVFDHRNIKDTCENCPLHYSLPTFPCLYLVLLLVAEKSEIENAFWFVHLQARQHIVLFTRKYIPVVCICIFKRTFVINIRRSFLSVLLNLSVQLILLGAVFGLDHVRPCRLHWEPLSCFSSLVLLT